MTALLDLTVNGEPRRTAAATIAALVTELGLKPEKVAVERNGTIVPRSTLADAPLADGDVLEIVHFVGGGNARISAYNCNLEGPLVDLGPINLQEALGLIDQRWPFADTHFERAEDAVAQTMFGFSRADDDFIEVNLAGSNLITVRHETRPAGFFEKLFGQREYLVELSSRSELDLVVRGYFQSTSDGLAAMQRYPNKSRAR
jgi:thiamine biosynthesis protein ThiS